MCRSTPSSGGRRENVYITFKIVEGEPTRVTGLTVTGLDSLPEKIRTDRCWWTSRSGRAIRSTDTSCRSPPTPSPDASAIADIPPPRSSRASRRNKDANTAKVAMEVDPGAPAVIGTVTVEGTKRVEPNLVRKLLVSRPGRLYSQDELFQSQRNLYSSDLFRFATVNIDSADVQARRRLGAHAGSGERVQAPPDPERHRLRDRRLLSAARPRGPRATSSGATAGFST